MIRSLSIIICIMAMVVSCKTNVVEEQKIELKNQLIGLTSAHNARQLGGYQIGNQRIKDNLLLRSAKLSGLSGEDSTLLADKYKVQCIYDFRGKKESLSAPDVIPGKARFLSLALAFGGEDLLTVQPEDGAVIWHCTQGKDRAGSASAMLLAALGADRELIMADFILSKDYYDPMTSKIKTETESQQTVINTLISANPAIFEATLNKVDAKYGSLTNYLTECIGVTPEMMDVLRNRFLE